MKIEAGRKLDSFLMIAGVGGGKTQVLLRLENAAWERGDRMNEDLEESSQWENELDVLGANNSVEKYLEMLKKAPAFSRSKKALVEHLQELMSV